MIIWDCCCCIKVSINWKLCICSCCCLVRCSMTYINSWCCSSFLLSTSCCAWGRSFLAIMLQCHLHFFEFLLLVMFHSLPLVSFVLSVSRQGSLELCFSFPPLWHYRLSFCHFALFLQQQLSPQVLFQRHSNLYLLHLPFLILCLCSKYVA